MRYRACAPLRQRGAQWFCRALSNLRGKGPLAEMIDNSTRSPQPVQYLGELGEDVVVRRTMRSPSRDRGEKTARIVSRPARARRTKQAYGSLIERSLRIAARVCGPQGSASLWGASSRARAQAWRLCDSHKDAGYFGPSKSLVETRYHTRGRKGNAAGVPGDHGVDAGRRDHGRAPQNLARGRRSVPSGVDPD